MTTFKYLNRGRLLDSSILNSNFCFKLSFCVTELKEKKRSTRDVLFRKQVSSGKSLVQKMGKKYIFWWNKLAIVLWQNIGAAPSNSSGNIV